MEINVYHPLIKELQKRVEANKDDQTAKDLARVMFETATMRSGFAIKDSADFAGRIERMLRLSMGVDLDAKVDLPEEEEEAAEETTEEVSVYLYLFNLKTWIRFLLKSILTITDLLKKRMLIKV